jgi:ribokinase
MKLGLDQMKRIYSRTDLFIVNVEEAQRILNTQSREIKSLMKLLAAQGPKLIAVTDNTDGAYLYDGDHFYHIPMYPDPRPAFERTGCGDAWASTFVSALALGKSPLEALLWAPINPMSVAQFIGAQEGLLTMDQLEWWLHRAPGDYKPKEI